MLYTSDYNGEEHAEKWLLSHEETESISSSVYLVMEEGQKISLSCGWMNGTKPGEENGNSDLVLSANLFTPEQIAQIEPEKVTGVEIQGVYYEIKK